MEKEKEWREDILRIRVTAQKGFVRGADSRNCGGEKSHNMG